MQADSLQAHEVPVGRSEDKVPTLLIGYDLNAPGQDYGDLIEAVKASGARWHYLDSTWLVKTSLPRARCATS